MKRGAYFSTCFIHPVHVARFRCSRQQSAGDGADADSSPRWGSRAISKLEIGRNLFNWGNSEFSEIYRHSSHLHELKLITIISGTVYKFLNKSEMQESTMILVIFWPVLVITTQVIAVWRRKPRHHGFTMKSFRHVHCTRWKVREHRESIRFWTWIAVMNFCGLIFRNHGNQMAPFCRTGARPFPMNEDPRHISQWLNIRTFIQKHSTTVSLYV